MKLDNVGIYNQTGVTEAAARFLKLPHPRTHYSYQSRNTKTFWMIWI